MAEIEALGLMPGVCTMLEARLGRAGYRLGTVVVVAVTFTLILLPFAMLLLIARSVLGPIDLSPFSWFLNLALSLLIAVLIATATMFVAARVIYAKRFKRLEEDKRRHAEHLRMHRENPQWHIVIRNLDDIQRQVSEITGVVQRYQYEQERDPDG